MPAVPGLTYVGRLDLLTEGLLLLTTDGAAAHRLTHPSHEIEREYVVTVQGDLASALPQLRRGVELDDGLARVARVSAEPLGRGRHQLTLVLAEGRTREVRRLAKAVGLVVDRLVRVRYGPVTLGTLPVGTWRSLSEDEAVALGVAAAAAGGTRRPPRRR